MVASCEEVSRCREQLIGYELTCSHLKEPRKWLDALVCADV